MTGRIQKTVFISYRRSHFPWAYCIYQNLTHHGFDVFFDYQSIDSGSFERVILDNIRARAHFIVILTAPSALERCSEPGDWLRREIETAMDEGRNIIPIMLESFDFGSPLVSQSLTGKLASLSSYNGLRLIEEYMDAAFEKLRNRFLNVALKDIPLHALTDQAKEITRKQKAAADQAPPIEKHELTAQVWLERGYLNTSNDDIDEAIRCFTESINLRRSYEAYYCRAICRRQKGDLDSAIQDYTIAISINPVVVQAYNNRGNAYRDHGDWINAMRDYNRAIRIKKDAVRAYINRGVLHWAEKNMDGAMEDFNEAIHCPSSPEERAEVYYRRGRLFQLKGELKEAAKELRRALYFVRSHVLARASLVSVLRNLADNDEANEQEELGRELLRREVEYIQACFESILGNTGDALELLKLAIQRRQVTQAWAKKDPDLENVRNDPHLEEMVNK